MFLYNLTLQRSTGITHAVHGNFSGTKEQEIAASRGKVLELLKLDPNTGKIQTLLSVEIFGIIRSMVTFRLAGTAKDYLIIGSDSGSIVIVEYNPQKNAFEKVHQAAFGKSGCRRTVPGQYLAVDPRGRAVMIGAIEKQKLIYIVDHTASHLTLLPPLEVQSPSAVVYDMVGIDVGFGSPVFACLEMDYEKSDSDPSGEEAQKAQQALTFYELDLGLNHIVRKYSEPLEEHGNFLISVPGGSEGPGGVLVCSENYITYKNFGDQPDIHCPIPRRRNDLDCPERGIIFVCSAVYKTKTLCFLAQTEQGDIFKITLETVEDTVTELKLKYFDTVPVASAMCVLKRSFLFVAAEFGNHFLYQIVRLGDDDDEPVFSSVVAVSEGDTFFFAPRALKNLNVLDELESLSPIMCSRIADLANEGSPQVYIACGRGPRSSLRVLRHGLEVSEVAVFELPGNPNAVWTLKRRADDEYHAYIILSFINATLVLSIGKTVEEVTDSGFLGATPTLACAQMGHDALVQIYPEGIHHVSANRIVSVWCTPKGKTISTCAVNQRQVVIALNGGELVYFEMDMSGKLNEYSMKAMPADVMCMALADVPIGKRKSMFLAVGLIDETVRVLSLDSSECLNILSMQSPPQSLAFVEVRGRGQNVLYLNIGLQNGILLRTVLDQATGDLSDTCTKYLGVKPVQLFKASMLGNDAVIAMSSQSWLIYYHQNRLHVTPLSYETLDYASGFVTRQVSAGIVAISSNTLRILSLERLGGIFSQVSTPLEYTPKKFVIHPENNYLYLIQTDHNAYTEKTKVIRKQQMAEKMAAAFVTENLSEVDFGSPKGGPGSWASMIAVINPVDGRTLHEVKLEQNEAAFSVCLVRFASQGDDLFLLVGIAKDLHLNPHHCGGGGIINTYRLASDGKELEFVYKTEVDEVPAAICPFQGRVLIGVGKFLRIYDMGKKKLLRKCENRHIPNQIVTIHSTGNRVIVGDTQESFYYVRYKCQENQLEIFADDTNPRWTTAACLLDCDTIAGADRFGNVYVLRLPTAVCDESEEDPVGVKAQWDKGWLSKCSQKAEIITSFHVGEVVLSLQKATLTPGGSESLVYMTLSGTIGVLMPFTTHEDHDFFQNLEMQMRSENPPLCGRDHLSFRSLYFAVKNVIDGDLCEQFNCLDPAKQRAVAENLERSAVEVSKKMEDMRARYAF